MLVKPIKQGLEVLGDTESIEIRLNDVGNDEVSVDIRKVTPEGWTLIGTHTIQLK